MARKLIVRLKGGLGNQLFCYAAARRLALVNDAELVLDEVSGFRYDHSYRRDYSLGIFQIPARFATPAERMEPLGRLRRLIARKVSETKPLAHRAYIMQRGVDYDPDILTLRLQKGMTYFDPFGQSEQYFIDIVQLLMQDLAMSIPAENFNLEMGEQIAASPSVALHVRWFDLDGRTSTSNISLTYYTEAISQLIAKIGRAHIYIFSDQPDLTSAFLGQSIQGLPHTIISFNARRGNAAADFWLMRQCRHFIIGNSTFAWWAAWLGEHSQEGVQVFAPGQCIDPLSSVTAWGFPGLLPKRWTIL